MHARAHGGAGTRRAGRQGDVEKEGFEGQISRRAKDRERERPLRERERPLRERDRGRERERGRKRGRE